MSPTACRYAPPGEYVKDHTLVFHDGWWHLFSISGTAGYYHGYTGNEETLSWSISRDLSTWEFRGHVMHPSQRPGTFDQHAVWAPHCLRVGATFHLFYTGVIHPHRPMEYRRLGSRHPWVAAGHREAQGLAVSEDLTDWVKVGDAQAGLGVEGRDAHVVRAGEVWLLYTTVSGQGQMSEAHVARSADLRVWEPLGVCARFPRLDPGRRLGATTDRWPGFKEGACTTESLFVMRHPRTRRWLLLGNWQYAVSDDPTDFRASEVRYYDASGPAGAVDMGFACEIIRLGSDWYRSGVFGPPDRWELGFTRIRWGDDAASAFTVVEPSVLAGGRLRRAWWRWRQGHRGA